MMHVFVFRYVRQLSLKLAGLPLRKMRLITRMTLFGVATLTCDLLIWELVQNVKRDTDNLPANCGTSATFFSSYGQTRVKLATYLTL